MDINIRLEVYVILSSVLYVDDIALVPSSVDLLYSQATYTKIHLSTAFRVSLLISHGKDIVYTRGQTKSEIPVRPQIWRTRRIHPIHLVYVASDQLIGSNSRQRSCSRTICQFTTRSTFLNIYFSFYRPYFCLTS